MCPATGSPLQGSAKLQVTGKGGKTTNVTASWGEDDVDGVGPTNDLYDVSLYASFSKATQHSLRRVDEERINYELILGIVEMSCTTILTMLHGNLLVVS